MILNLWVFTRESLQQTAKDKTTPKDVFLQSATIFTKLKVALNFI